MKRDIYVYCMLPTNMQEFVTLGVGITIISSFFELDSTLDLVSERDKTMTKPLPILSQPVQCPLTGLHGHEVRYLCLLRANNRRATICDHGVRNNCNFRSFRASFHPRSCLGPGQDRNEPLKQSVAVYTISSSGLDDC